MRDKVKIGVLGFGDIAKRYLPQIQRQVKNLEIVAAYSHKQNDLVWAKSTLNVPYVYSDHKSLVDNHEVEGIIIFSEVRNHAVHFLDAIKANKHVLCMPPLGLNVEDCEAVVSAAKSRPSQVSMLAFEHRYHPAYINAKLWIQEGRIGTPIFVNSYTLAKETNDKEYRQESLSRGGIFMEHNIRNVDIVRWLTGHEFKAVTSLGESFKYKFLEANQDADNVMTVAQLSGNTMAHIMASRTIQHGYDTKTVIHGTEGSIEINPKSSLDSIKIYDKQGVHKQMSPQFFDTFEQALCAQAIDFADCILNDRKPKVDLEDGLEATKAIVAMTKSFLMRKTIDFTESQTEN